MGKLLKKVGYAGSKEKEHSWRTGVQRGYCKTGNPWARMSVQRRVRDGGDRRAARRRVGPNTGGCSGGHDSHLSLCVLRDVQGAHMGREWPWRREHR